MSAERNVEWHVEGIYSNRLGWELLTCCETAEEADEMVRCYRQNEPRTPVRRRRVES